MSEYINITSLREGDQGVIHSIEGGAAITSRLAGMGIVTNAKFRIAQVSGALSLFR
jgi:ferrous iron transport protein B